MPKVGVEPTRALCPLRSERNASADSATPAKCLFYRFSYSCQSKQFGETFVDFTSKSAIMRNIESGKATYICKTFYIQWFQAQEIFYSTVYCFFGFLQPIFSRSLL